LESRGRGTPLRGNAAKIVDQALALSRVPKKEIVDHGWVSLFDIVKVDLERASWQALNSLAFSRGPAPVIMSLSCHDLDDSKTRCRSRERSRGFLDFGFC
jgi:hypothetical protein